MPHELNLQTNHVSCCVLWKRCRQSYTQDVGQIQCSFFRSHATEDQPFCLVLDLSAGSSVMGVKNYILVINIAQLTKHPLLPNMSSFLEKKICLWEIL